MFTIYHSNQLALLKTLIAELIKRDPIKNPFEKEVILVQSQGMAQWLQMELATELGIAANIQFSLPASFIWQLFSAVIPDLPQESAFSKSAMTWKLMELLSIFSSDRRFEPIFDYLSGGNTLKKYYQFSAMTADLYDQYLVYRPEWMTAWEQGKSVSGLGEHQLWQAELWQALVCHTKKLEQSIFHRANLHRRVLSAFENGDVNLALLPKRLFICGIAAFPPTYLQILQALSRYIPVHFMFTNPCRWYWGEIYDNITQLKQAAALRRFDDEKSRAWVKFDSRVNISDADPSNPLLASWGKLGRDNLFLLQDVPGKQEIDAFVDIDGNSLLHALQQDILELVDRSAVNSPSLFETSMHKKTVNQSDKSLQLHVCHSAQREVEVLYDQLLAMLDADPALQPRDIIVMVADIDHYAPYIQAVFSQSPASRFLPFSISDRKMSSIDPVIRTFLSLLRLPQSRCSAEQILSFLEVPAFADKFSIDETAFSFLQQWIAESGIRWGLDDTTAQDFDLPATGKNTWRFGLMRMLLGYAMNGSSGVWRDHAPYDETSGLIAEIAGKLADLVEKLIDWRARFSKAMLLSDWLPLCHQLLDTFFVTETETESLLAFIENTWQNVIDSGLLSSYQLPVSGEILHDMLQSEFEQSHMSQRFLAGKINFCTLMPMRSIPFKVVCLLGMNDGVYPRIQLPVSFDLMADHVQRGDRSRRDDDRYLFLEALLSAQHALYISYIGFSIQDNAARYPSVLVTELFDYLTQSYVLHGDEALTVDESAVRLQHHLTLVHTRMPFDAQNYQPHSRQQSYADEWLPSAKRAFRSVKSALPAPETVSEITMDALQRFYRHSVKAFFEQRLHVYFSEPEQMVSDDEPFSLTGLQRYQLDQRLLSHAIDEQPDDNMLSTLTASGMLPYGAFGQRILQQRKDEMTELADKIRRLKQEQIAVEIDLNIDSVHLVGWLSHVQSDGLLRWRAGELSIVDGMRLWIDHVIYAVTGQQKISRMFGRKETEWAFLPLTAEEARQHLSVLICGYQRGINAPLLLPLKSAWKWLTSAGRINEQNCWHEDASQSQQAEQKLHDAWSGGWQQRGEGEDDYYQRIVPGALSDNELALIKSHAALYLLPILQNKLAKGDDNDAD